MRSSLEETIVSDEGMNEEIQQKKKENKKIENSFFTSSLELSDDDLKEINEEEEEEVFFDDNEKFPVLKVVFTIVGTIIFIAVIGFIVYEYFLKI